MPITITERVHLRKDGDFNLRVVEALTIVAGAVLKEAAETANHAKRLKWAKRTLRELVPETRKVLNVLFTSAQIENKGKLVTDDELITAVTSAVDLLTDD